MQFDAILADPPWGFENSRMANRSADTKYHTMSTFDLADLDIKSIAAKDSVCLMWAVPAMLREALQVLEAWGFEYKTMLPWLKITDSSTAAISKIVVPDGFAALTDETVQLAVPAWGLGWWVRGCMEPLLIGVRGKPQPVDQWLGLISQNFKHSRKPANAHIYAAQFGRNRVELFARRHVPGWVCTGLEADGLDVRDFIEYVKAADEKAVRDYYWRLS